jgi:hypothetical protein
MLGVKEASVLVFRERGSAWCNNIRQFVSQFEVVCYSPYFCMCIPPPIYPRQRLGKHVSAVTNTTLEELLDVSSSMHSVS